MYYWSSLICFRIFERYDIARNSRPRADERFKVFWNVPSFQCHKYGVNFTSVSAEWGITQNPEDSFRGEEVAILYDPGLFPALLPTTVGRSPELRNGGVPQQGDLALHLSRFQEDVDKLLPDTRFSGKECLLSGCGSSSPHRWSSWARNLSFTYSQKWGIPCPAPILLCLVYIIIL